MIRPPGPIQGRLVGPNLQSTLDDNQDNHRQQSHPVPSRGAAERLNPRLHVSLGRRCRARSQWLPSSSDDHHAGASGALRWAGWWCWRPSLCASRRCWSSLCCRSRSGRIRRSGCSMMCGPRLSACRWRRHRCPYSSALPAWGHEAACCRRVRTTSCALLSWISVSIVLHFLLGLRAVARQGMTGANNSATQPTQRLSSDRTANSASTNRG
jgi:hypothetical protein